MNDRSSTINKGDKGIDDGLATAFSSAAENRPEQSIEPGRCKGAIEAGFKSVNHE